MHGLHVRVKKAIENDWLAQDYQYNRKTMTDWITISWQTGVFWELFTVLTQHTFRKNTENIQLSRRGGLWITTCCTFHFVCTEYGRWIAAVGKGVSEQREQKLFVETFPSEKIKQQLGFGKWHQFCLLTMKDCLSCKVMQSQPSDVSATIELVFFSSSVTDMSDDS